jgi:hypothetical protein
MQSAINWASEALCWVITVGLILLWIGIAIGSHLRRVRRTLKRYRRNWGHGLEQHSSYFAGLHRVPPDDLS